MELENQLIAGDQPPSAADHNYEQDRRDRGAEILSEGRWATFVILAFGLSWAVWAPAVLATFGVVSAPFPLEALTPVSIFVGAFGPLVAALILSRRGRGGEGPRMLLRRGIQWRTIGLASTIVIFGLPFAVNFVARSLDIATGGVPPEFSVESTFALIPIFLAILLLGGPVQEEFGWRGYALPRLLARFGPVLASLILGVVWAAWHLPFWFMEGAGMEGTPMPIYLLYTIGLTAVMTWLYYETAGSVLAAILMHTTANWISNVLPTHAAESTASNAYLFQATAYAVVGMALLWATTRANGQGPSRRAARPAEIS